MTAIYQKFGCTYAGDGSPSTTGNVSTVTGQSGTFVEGKDFSYLYRQGPDNYVDYISANGGTIIYASQDGRGRAVCYDGGNNGYRAIHSAFIFGALRNGIDNKNELMNLYVNYLTELIGIEEITDDYVQNLSLFPNPCAGKARLSFNLSQASQVNVTIYNLAGQVVRQLADQKFAQGNHQLIWDRTDGAGKIVSSGSYIIRIDVDGNIINKVLVLVK